MSQITFNKLKIYLDHILQLRSYKSLQKYSKYIFFYPIHYISKFFSKIFLPVEISETIVKKNPTQSEPK